jgi:hypothetical protein
VLRNDEDPGTHVLFLLFLTQIEFLRLAASKLLLHYQPWCGSNELIKNILVKEIQIDKNTQRPQNIPNGNKILQMAVK